jgi:hypothetical protein
VKLVAGERLVDGGGWKWKEGWILVLLWSLGLGKKRKRLGKPEER